MTALITAALELGKEAMKYVNSKAAVRIIDEIESVEKELQSEWSKYPRFDAAKIENLEKDVKRLIDRMNREIRMLNSRNADS